MREIRIEKVSLNIGVGKPGDELEKAVKLLGVITGAKPVKTSVYNGSSPTKPDTLKTKTKIRETPGLEDELDKILL